MFVFSTTLLCLYVFGFCWVYIVKIRNAEQITIWKAMSKTPASIALIIYTFIAVWFVGGLSVFHLYLMSTNQVKTVSHKDIFLVLHGNYVVPLPNQLPSTFVDNIWELQISLWSTSQPIQQGGRWKHQGDLLYTHPSFQEQLPWQGPAGAWSKASCDQWFHESKHGESCRWHWDG